MSSYGPGRWDPWSDFISLRDAMDRLLSESVVSPRSVRGGQAGRSIPVDIRDEDDRYLLHADLPGIRPDDIHINVLGNTLTIQAEPPTERTETTATPEQAQNTANRQTTTGTTTRSTRPTTTSDRTRWLMRERRVGRMTRTVTLPTDVDASRAEADFEHGILTVSLPKLAAATTRTIPIRAGTGFHGPASTSGERTVYSPIQTEATGTPPTAGEYSSAGSAHPYVEANQPRAQEVPVTSATTPTVAAESPGTASGEGTVDRSQIKEGFEVVGPDMSHIGSVKEVRGSDFLVDRSMQRDVYVPFDAVMSVAETRVVLGIQADQVDDMDWAKPSV